MAESDIELAPQHCDRIHLALLDSLLNLNEQLAFAAMRLAFAAPRLAFAAPRLAFAAPSLTFALEKPPSVDGAPLRRKESLKGSWLRHGSQNSTDREPFSKTWASISFNNITDYPPTPHPLLA